MHKVAIVDDDRIIRRGLVNTIPWERYGYQLVGEASDGEQGLKLIDDFQPQIVISDIKMPFMDGLEMARIAKEKYPEIKLILLTGYDDFTYAQEAIKIRAFDYLLKPVDKEVLLEKVLKASAEWDNEHKTKQKIHEGMPFFKMKFFKRLLENQWTENEMLGEAAALGMQFTGQTFVVLLIKLDGRCTVSPQTTGAVEAKDDFKQYIFNVCEELMWREQKGSVVEYEGDELILIYTSNETAEVAAQGARELAERIKHTVKHSLQTTVTITLGGAHAGCSSIAMSYRQARAALEFRHLFGKDKVFSMVDIGCSSSHGSVEINGKEAEITEKVKLGFVQDALRLLDDLEQEMLQQKSISLHHVRLISVQLVISLFRGAGQWAKEWEAVQRVNISLYYTQINGMQTIAEMMLLVRQIISDLAVFIATRRESMRCQAVAEAVAYIEEHYAEQELSLQDVAKHVHMNPVYLSGLFKQEKNINFSDYLLQTKMRHAMELLRCDNMKTYEVAQRVGYSNPQYFSVCFKKYTGISPLEFKNKS
jgi:two-component system, response regulator YesN